MKSLDICREAERRALKAHAARMEGLTYKEVGKLMGVQEAYGRQLALKGQRIIDRKFQHIAEALEMLQKIEFLARVSHKVRAPWL